MQTFADVVFLIEGTALNGAYMNELKANYVVPTLEYFSQGSVEDRDYYLTDRFTTQYGIVLYRTAANLLDTMSMTFGPFTSPVKVLETIEKLPLIGGGIESCANMAEGLATAHVCFDHLYERRKCLRMDHINVQRHCILLCNSPPYSMPVMENWKHNGKTVEQLAALLHERRINLSIIAPRKIPILYKLFMKADGDMPLTAKNQAKTIRHLVLLKGYSFKERSASPITNGMGPTAAAQAHMVQMGQHAQQPHLAQQQQQQQQSQQQQQQPTAMPMDTSPVHMQPQHTHMPQPPQQQQQQQQQQQPQAFMSAHGQNSGQLQNVNFQTNMPQQNRWIYGPNQQGAHPRAPFMGGPGAGPGPGPGPVSGPTPMMNNANMNPANQNSALISQLSAPPNQAVNPLLQQQQLRLQMLNQQHMQQQQQQQMNHQNSQQQQQPLPNLPQTQPPHGPMGPVGVPSVPQVGGMPPAGNVNVPNSVANGPSMNQGNVSNVATSGQGNANHANEQAVMRDREKIWTGVLEWVEKTKPDQQKISRTLQCTVSTNIKDGEPEIRSDNWPSKLLMQLMPKHLVGNIGGQYLKDSKMVVFRPALGEALDALSKVMISGCAGIVHFTTSPTMPACDIKVLVLLYTAEKNAFLGFIPNNQVSFVDRLRKVIQQRQNATATGVGVGPHMPQQQQQQQQQPGPAQQQQMNLLANKMGGPMQNLPQNVLAAQQQMQQNMHGQVEGHQQHFNQYSGQMNMGAVPGPGVAAGGVPPGNANALHHQQQMSMMPSQQQQQQQQQQRMGMVSGNVQQMAPHAVAAAAAAAAAMQQQQRMVRPMMSNNPGLRHLLQQQSAPVNQFRPQMGGVAGGPGGPVSGPGVSQMSAGGSGVANRPFDDSNYEYM